MSVQQTFVIPVRLGVLSTGESALIQDVANGEIAERMSDADLSMAVLDIAAEADAFSMRYAMLDEAARRLAPELFTEAANGAAGEPGIRLTALEDQLRQLSPLALIGAGVAVGVISTVVSVYIFFTHVIH